MESRQFSTPWRAALCVAALVAMAGCGHSTDSAKPQGGADQPAPEAAAPAGEPVPNAVADQAVAPEWSPPKKSKPAPPQTTPPSRDPSINPDDVFEVVAAGPVFEVAGSPGAPASADALTAVVPPSGVDSTRFRYAGSINDEAGGLTGSRASGVKPGASKKDADDQAGPVKRLPAGFTPISYLGKSRLGWPLRIRCNRDGAEMAFVVGGAAVVGHEGASAESSPQLNVILDSFYMDVAEITLGQYERFRERLREEKGQRIVREPGNVSSPADFPVLGVTLLQSQFYARWAGKEIPTEAEWERAARGEGAFDHPWGNGRPIWREARRPTEVTRVKSFRTDVSPFGIYDLAGNAREWCVDRYSATAFADALHASRAPLRNWKGPRTARPTDYHVVKGNGPNWEAWYRIGKNGSERHPDVGFRCVLRLPERNE